MKNIKILFKNKFKNTKTFSFNGICPNKLGNIVYILNYQKKLTSKSNRPIIPICDDEKYTYFVRLQGKYEPKVSWTIQELLIPLKKYQYGLMPLKDSYLCMDIIFKIETETLNQIFDKKCELYQKTNPLTTNEHLNLLKTIKKAVKTHHNHITLIEITKDIKALTRNATRIELNQKISYSKTIGQIKYSTVEQIRKEEFDNIKTLTFNEQLEYVLNNENLSNPKELNLFVLCCQKLIDELGQTNNGSSNGSSPNSQNSSQNLDENQIIKQTNEVLERIKNKQLSATKTKKTINKLDLDKKPLKSTKNKKKQVICLDKKPKKSKKQKENGQVLVHSPKKKKP